VVWETTFHCQPFPCLLQTCRSCHPRRQTSSSSRGGRRPHYPNGRGLGGGRQSCPNDGRGRRSGRGIGREEESSFGPDLHGHEHLRGAPHNGGTGHHGCHCQYGTGQCKKENFKHKIASSACVEAVSSDGHKGESFPLIHTKGEGKVPGIRLITSAFAVARFGSAVQNSFNPLIHQFSPPGTTRNRPRDLCGPCATRRTDPYYHCHLCHHRLGRSNPCPCLCCRTVHPSLRRLCQRAGNKRGENTVRDNAHLGGGGHPDAEACRSASAECQSASLHLLGKPTAASAPTRVSVFKNQPRNRRSCLYISVEPSYEEDHRGCGSGNHLVEFLIRRRRRCRGILSDHLGLLSGILFRRRLLRLLFHRLCRCRPWGRPEWASRTRPTRSWSCCLK